MKLNNNVPGKLRDCRWMTIGLLALGSLAGSLTQCAWGITWCHDYTLHRATDGKQDFNETDIDELRDWLKRNGYKSVPFTPAAFNKEVDPKAMVTVHPGDVIVFRSGNGHSAFVNSIGLLDHFIQSAGKQGVAREPGEVEKQPNFHRNDTLSNVYNKTYKMPVIPGAEEHGGGTVRPYKDYPVEIWRKESNYKEQSYSYRAKAGTTARGFDETGDEVDVSTAFHIQFPPPGNIVKAALAITAMPYKQLIVSDGLALKGSDGKTYWLPIKYAYLEEGKYQIVNIEVTEPTLLAAMKSGRIEGLVKDVPGIGGSRMSVPTISLILTVQDIGKGGNASSVTPTALYDRAVDPRTVDKEMRTASGLMIEEVRPGSGKEAKAGHSVTVHYRGTLTNGTKFDASYDRGEPFTFNLGAGEVIKGWDEGVAGMKEGAKRKLTIPSELGYGARGAGGLIPPHATLVFEVELLKVN